MCMHLWFLCGWQGISWHLDICINMPRLPLIVAYMFFIYHPSSMSSSTIQSCLGSNWIFQFTPCAPHHNHPNYFHPTMGAHLLCLKSITCHNFQFGPKGFELFFPSMVQASPSFFMKFSKMWPTTKKFLTSSPPLWSNTPCPFVDKGHQTFAISLWLHLKIFIQTILETFQNFEVWYIMKNHLILPKTYAPWLGCLNHSQNIKFLDI